MNVINVLCYSCLVKQDMSAYWTPQVRHFARLSAGERLNVRRRTSPSSLRGVERSALSSTSAVLTLFSL